jgi:hypothetical protein
VTWPKTLEGGGGKSVNISKSDASILRTATRRFFAFSVFTPPKYGFENISIFYLPRFKQWPKNYS